MKKPKIECPHCGHIHEEIEFERPPTFSFYCEDCGKVFLVMW